MTVQPDHYEETLADCSDHLGAITLLKQYRPYLEMVPSMRRSQESVVTIPLPLIRIRGSIGTEGTGNRGVVAGEVLRLPCEVAILMCDPEWKIKTGVEIFVFIHRPQEDFSELLNRWRRTQILLDKGYEWLMPSRHQHLLSDGADKTRPLFVVFPETPERIRRGLKGAYLPFVTKAIYAEDNEPDPNQVSDALSSEILEPDE